MISRIKELLTNLALRFGPQILKLKKALKKKRKVKAPWKKKK